MPKRKICLAIPEEDRAFMEARKDEGFNHSVTLQAAIEQLRKLSPHERTKALLRAMASRSADDGRRG